jgi:hypothetical protein
MSSVAENGATMAPQAVARIALKQVPADRPTERSIPADRPTQRPRSPALYHTLSEVFPAMAFMLAAVLASACSSTPADEFVHPEVSVGSTSQALQASAITKVSGRYETSQCTGHGTDEPWTVDLVTPAASTLSVRVNNVNCRLYIDSITAGAPPAGGTPAAGTYSYPGGQILTLAFGAVMPMATGGFAPAFYAAGKIDTTDFKSNYTITLLVGDGPNAVSAGSKPGKFKTNSVSVSASTVTAANYAFDFAPMTVNEDVNNLTVGTDGYVALTAGTNLAQDYVVSTAALDGSSSLAAVDAAWTAAGAPVLLSSLMPALQVPSTNFKLVDGTNLNTHPVRSVILRNTVSGISSYQLIQVTFGP